VLVEQEAEALVVMEKLAVHTTLVFQELQTLAVEVAVLVVILMLVVVQKVFLVVTVVQVL
jgi:hypothetical protein